MAFDPVIEAFLERIRSFSARGLPSVDEVIQGREALNAATSENAAPPREDVEISDVEAGGVLTRLYRPRREVGPLPLHVYFHGGAFIFGSAFSGAQDAELAERAAVAGCVVASVEYRLAPENRFPAGVEDCYSALVGLVEGADEFGIDPTLVTVGGASSGGNFAAVVALICAERGGPRLAGQLLEIAGTDLTKSSSAWRNPVAGHDTTREADLHLIDMYLNSVAERADPHGSPLFAADLSAVAPAYVMNAEFDPRRDECEAYVVRLRDAGVAAVTRTMAGHVHGSMSLPDWPPALAWRREANETLARINSRVFDWTAL